MDKLKNQLQVSVSNNFVDEGDGVVSFPGGLTITDDSVMRSGTRYDVASLDISQYGGQLTGDHIDSLGTLIGKTIGVVKQGNRVAVSGIKYAVNENPYARLAYNLLVGGFSNSFSIETIGPYPDQQDPVYRNHELVGLSQVVVPNNYNAKVNQFNEIVHNSLERSQQDGLDITGVEEKIFSSVELKSSDPVKEDSMTEKKQDTSEIDEVVNDNAEAEVVETPTEVEAPAEEKTEEVESEAQAEVEVEAPAEADADATEVEAEAETEEKEEEAPAESEEKETEEEAVAVDTDEVESEETEEESAEEVEETEVENQTNKNKETLEMTADQIAEIVANAIKPLAEELSATKELAQNALDSQAKEPEFVAKAPEVVANSYDGMSADELAGKQLNAAVAVERMQSVEGAKVLHEINAHNLNALKEAKIVNASLALSDLGNFVISPELYNQIATVRTNYTALLDATNWKETNSIEFGWLTRSSDIDMSNVALGIAGDDGERLKPVSTPGYGAHSEKLEELAAVTPISINVIKFAAADILSDIAEGYRHDYDRKRAQLIIARLQQAVDTTGNVWTFNANDGLLGWAEVVALISDVTTVGTLIFSNRTLAVLKGQAIKTLNAAILLEISNNMILGTPFITVPNELLPTLDSSDSRTFAVNGENVVVDSAVFYANLSTFTGRTSGGLKYDIDGSASYEIGGTVYSAYQRNEVVLRGSFFRGGVVKDVQLVAAIRGAEIS